MPGCLKTFFCPSSLIALLGGWWELGYLPGGGVYLGQGIHGEGVPPVLQILTLFQTKNWIFHTRFQTWPLGNYVTITEIRTPTKNISNFASNSHISLSFLFIIRSYTSVYIYLVSSKTIPGSRPKWAKPIPVFKPKRRKNYTLCSCTYRTGLYKGSPPVFLIICALLFWSARITFCSTAWTSLSSLNTWTIRQFILRNISIVKNRWIHWTSPTDYCSSLNSYEDKTVIAWRLLYDVKRTWLKKTSGHMKWCALWCARFSTYNFSGFAFPAPGVGESWEFLVGVCSPVLQILTRLQTKKCNFPHPFSDLAFKQKFCYHYLV